MMLSLKLSRTLKKLAQAIQEGNHTDRAKICENLAKQMQQDVIGARDVADTAVFRDVVYAAVDNLREDKEDKGDKGDKTEYEKLRQGIVQELQKQSTGNSVERLLAGKQMLAWLEILPPTAGEWFAAFFKVARRLFLDKTTAIWRTGAYCMGRMFHYTPARELLLRSLPARPGTPSPTGSLNVHADKRALAALGAIARHDTEFACWQVDAIFRQMEGETRSAFKQRSSNLTEWLVFALPDLRQAAPEYAREVFNTLAQKPVAKGGHYQIHFNLALIAEELFAAGWHQDIRNWYNKLTSDLDRIQKPEPAKRYPYEKIKLSSGYQSIGRKLQPSAEPHPPGFSRQPYTEIDQLDRSLQNNVEAIIQHQGSVVERHEKFVCVTDTIYAFFEPDRHIRMWSDVVLKNSAEARRFSQLASNACRQLERLLESELKYLDYSEAGRRGEAKHYFSNGLHLLTTVIAALPDRNDRITAYQKTLFDIRIKQPQKSPMGQNDGYYQTAAERLFDDIWHHNAGNSDGRCAEIHKLVYQLVHSLNGKGLFEKMLKLVREPELETCLKKRCDSSLKLPTHQECRPHCPFWKSFLLPQISRLNWVLTSTADDRNGLMGLLQATTTEFSLPFDAEQARQALWGRLMDTGGHRHELRDNWGKAQKEERIQTYRYLLAFFENAFKRVLELYCPASSLPNKLQDVSISAKNFAVALLTPVGRHRPPGSPLATYLNTTLLGVLQAPEGGSDQLTHLTLLRRLEDGCRINELGRLTWTSQQSLCEPDSKWVHIHISGSGWKLPFPWYLITGLIQALCEDQQWQEYNTIQIERSCKDNAYQIVIYPLHTHAASWRLDGSNPLITGDLPPDSGGHKVGFWLYWINRIVTLAEEKPAQKYCWKIDQPSDASISARLRIGFSVPTVYH